MSRICGNCSVDLDTQDHKATCKHSDKCPGCEKLEERVIDLEIKLLGLGGIL